MNVQSIPHPSANIQIIGAENFFHEALSHVLSRELGVHCSTHNDPRWSDHAPGGERVLFLINGEEKDFRSIILKIHTNSHIPEDSAVLALFNLASDQGIEKYAFEQGVRGFFYCKDNLRHMLKGINALLHGELWVSREILVEFALRGSNKKSGILREKSMLTNREMQILALVSVGASNEEIADKLFVSHHTVKTHLYNIFRKIGVPNRFQAALWAAKNL